MKILMLNRLSPINAHSGTEIFAWDLAAGLQSRGHEIAVAYGSRRLAKHHDVTLTLHEIPLTPIPYLRSLEFRTRTPKVIRKIISAEHYDAILGFGAGTFFGSILRRVKADIDGIYSAYYAIDSMATEYRRTLPEIEARGFWPSLRAKVWYSTLVSSDRESCKRSSIVLASSNDTANSVSADYGVEKEKIRILKFGLPRDFEVGFSATDPVEPMFLHVATIPERKGTTHFLHALKILAERYHKNARAVVCGSNLFPDYPRLARELNVQTNFFENVPRNRMKELYASCTALVSPSLSEGFGLPVVEAFSFGKPVIASNLGSLPELVEDGVTGFLVSPRNEEALAERMNRIIEDEPLRRKMSSNATKASREFSIDAVCDRFDSILKDARPKN